MLYFVWFYNEDWFSGHGPKLGVYKVAGEGGGDFFGAITITQSFSKPEARHFAL